MQPALPGLYGTLQLVVWQRSHGQQSSIVRVVIQDKAVVLCSMAHRLQLPASTLYTQRLAVLRGSSAAAPAALLCMLCHQSVAQQYNARHAVKKLTKKVQVGV